MGLLIKFGTKGIKLLSEIKPIEEISRLEMIKEAVKVAKDVSE